MIRNITIGRIGGQSANGEVILYDKNNGNVLQIPSAWYPIGTKLHMDKEGNWKAAKSSEQDEFTQKLVEQSEKFYYATKEWLPYRAYQRVRSIFPDSCYDKFVANPYYLLDVTYEGGSPVTTFPNVDSHIVLASFADRMKEMKKALIYVLERNEDCGHTLMKYEDLEQNVKSLLRHDGHPLLTGNVSAYLAYYQELFYFENGLVALRSTYEKEEFIYKRIKYANSLQTPYPQFTHVENEDFSTEQNLAIKNLVLKGGHFCILTGGPGTGKTTILKCLVDELKASYSDTNIYLLSPTGKAARRIREVFGFRDISISTIHKFLGYGHKLTPKERAVIRNAGMLIIDESSMLDLQIFYKLISLIDFERTKIVLVGDVDQLPSIGAGNILADLINIGVHTEHLSANFRSHGSIVDNAIAINKGCLELKEDDQFKIIETPVMLQNLVAGLTETDIVITPYRVEFFAGSTQECVGSSEIVNRIAQRRFLGRETKSINVGDRIIMNKTNYAAGYCNGETGVVLSKLPNGDYYIGFGDRELTVKNPEHISLGYAITVHKSQGSEYANGVICIPPHSDFVTKRMLYTAVTRCKQFVTIQGSREDIRRVIMNNNDEKRMTFLGTFPKIA